METDTDGMGDSECRAQLDLAAAQCLPGMNVFATYDEGSSTVILVDDPAASVGVGPGFTLAIRRGPEIIAMAVRVR
jgi:hypothetical protein